MLDFSPEMTDLFRLACTILFTLWVEKVGSNFVSGFMFFFGSRFNEGDEVYIEGERAFIVKQGIQTTIFQLEDSNRGYVWRYVRNNRISWLKLEKVIRSQELSQIKKQNMTMKQGE